MTQKAMSGPKCGLGYDWLCADGGPWLLGDWDMSLPMISFTVERKIKRLLYASQNIKALDSTVLKLQHAFK